MAYAAKVKSFAKDPSGLGTTLVVEFSKDGIAFKTVPFNGLFTDEQLKFAIGNQIAQYEKIDGFSLATNDDVTPAKPELPPAPTPGQIATQEFIAKYQSLKMYQRAVAQGFTQPDDKDFVELQTAVKQLFKPEYLQYLN